MRHWLLRSARVLLLTAAATLSATSNTPARTVTAPVQDQTEIAKAPYEVRLRKLHLVRPDLIPYPIFFDVYC
jgi:hypothetical protein